MKGIKTNIKSAEYKVFIVAVYVFVNILYPHFSTAQFQWQKQYDAPFTDVNNNVLTSTEIVDMVAHKGKIYAACSNWNNPNDRFNGQVVVKSDASTDWVLDEHPAGRISRASSIISAVFQTDRNGMPLVQPDTILFIGTTTHKGLQATYPGKVGWRDDVSGDWHYYDLAFASHAMNRTEIRSMGFYRDKITNTDIVFAGGTPAPLGIFAGRYDSSHPDKIVWDSVAEFEPVNFERILGFSECNGTLFAATKSRILRRNDGDSVSQRWVELINFLDAPYYGLYSPGLYDIYKFDEDIRSFRTTRLLNPTREVLTFTTFNRLFHFDPVSETLIEEINLKDWLQTATGNQYNYIQSGIISDFITLGSDTIQMIGIEAIFDTLYLAANPKPNFEGIDIRGFIITRKLHSNSTVDYSLISIADSLVPGDTLTRVRTILNSPFPGEAHTLYAGGFAPWGTDVEHTGWIYKGAETFNTYQNEMYLLQSDVNIFPNPASDKITVSTPYKVNGIKIFDLTGRLILSEDMAVKNEIALPDFCTSGVYIIRILTRMNEISKKLIINKNL